MHSCRKGALLGDISAVALVSNSDQASQADIFMSYNKKYFRGCAPI